MWPGYGGTVLDVNLTKLKTTKTPLEEGFARQFIGGRGFGAKLLYDNVKPKTDAFSPDNIVVIASGPACGTLWPKGNKLSLATRSALTDGYSDSHMHIGQGNVPIEQIVKAHKDRIEFAIIEVNGITPEDIELVTAWLQ